MNTPLVKPTRLYNSKEAAMLQASSSSKRYKMYDSRPDTQKHINQVITEGVKFTSKLRRISANLNNHSLDMLNKFIAIFQGQIAKHDASKLVSPEKDGFDKYTPMLAKMEYGSDEYKKCLKELQHPYLDYHYANNSHHPEHYKNGINGMNLFDVIEMYCDWKAAVRAWENNQINYKNGDQV